jgi:hypothetical protein
MNRKLKIWIGIVWILIALTIFIFIELWVVASNQIQIKKPAIYLYPIEDGQIEVSVFVNGKLTETIPEYGTGWDVFVAKDGIIENKYDYLFYEANLNKLELPIEGWVVKYGDLGSWFDKNLKLMGLNEKELLQFKEYWMKELPEKEYYLIKLFSKNYLEENLKLKFNPTPNTLIRLNFYFKPLNEMIKVESPNITTPTRNGFTVVEWGGVFEE